MRVFVCSCILLYALYYLTATLIPPSFPCAPRAQCFGSEFETYISSHNSFVSNDLCYQIHIIIIIIIMRQCTSVTDRSTDRHADGHWHRSISERCIYYFAP